MEIRAEAALFPEKEYINGTAVAVQPLELPDTRSLATLSGQAVQVHLKRYCDEKFKG